MFLLTAPGLFCSQLLKHTQGLVNGTSLHFEKKNRLDIYKHAQVVPNVIAFYILYIYIFLYEYVNTF